jgi:quinol monooxygenase YgiN
VNLSGRRRLDGLLPREDRPVTTRPSPPDPRRSSMFIAILDFSTTAADRQAALAQLDGELGDVHGMPGNIAFRVYAGREDDTRVTVVHEWQDEASFARYLDSASFARSAQALRPIMVEAPVSRRLRAELVETVA